MIFYDIPVTTWQFCEVAFSSRFEHPRTWTEPLWTWTYGSVQSSAIWLNWTQSSVLGSPKFLENRT
jgi:hypothetical protein